jgi:hypothetical protein
MMRGEGVVTVTLQLVFVFWPSCKSKVEKAFVGWKINWHLGGFKKQIGRAIDSCLLSVSVRFRHTRPPRPSWIYVPVFGNKVNCCADEEAAAAAAAGRQQQSAAAASSDVYRT